MKKLFFLEIFILIMASSCVNKNGDKPIAEKNPHEFEEFGNKRVDNYYWLKNRKDPKVMSYIKLENEYTKKHFSKSTQKLQDKLYQELNSRIVDIDSTVPYYENGYYYYTRYEKDKEYEIYCRKESLDSAEQILLDVNEFDESNDYVDVDNICISPNKNIMAYAIDTISRKKYEIRFKSFSQEYSYNDKIIDTDGQVVFANDSHTVFYITKDPISLRSFKLFRHILGQSSHLDLEIFYEDDAEYELFVQRSKSDKYLFLNHNSSTSSEVRILSASNPFSEFKIFRKRKEGLEYYIDHCNDKFWIRTNEMGKNFCIMTCDSEEFNDNWQVFIPHDNNVYIEDFEIFDNYLVLEERRNGLSCFEIVDIKTKERHLIDFGEEAYEVCLEDNPEPNSNILRYSYSSLTTPLSIIDYNMKTKEKTILKEKQIPNFDKNNYEVKRLNIDSRDNVKIPVTILYKKGTNLENQNNMLLYAYGAYGCSEEDGFTSSVFSLVDRGFIYAIAHVRGGSELGYQWYENGKLLNKMNTFNDFIDVSEYFINNNYTSPTKLFADGASAGGLLIGVIANMRPDLYKGLIAEVPFVDVVTTMNDPSIPLTTNEYDEWGNPNEKQYYDYMLKYSPYDNIIEQDYPAMFVTTGLYDSQVQYWEPLKWVAKLREFKTDKNPLYITVNMKTGHYGDSGRFERNKETSLIYAFILNLAGIKEK
ncbi:MAG: S9 family peptidase [Bacteroidales bacterium]|nr:S9 family peptidase [Bacteroidales bacterium]